MCVRVCVCMCMCVCVCVKLFLHGFISLKRQNVLTWSNPSLCILGKTRLCCRAETKLVTGLCLCIRFKPGRRAGGARGVGL